MKKLVNKTTLVLMISALAIIGIGYWIGMNYDAVGFTITNPEKVRWLRQATQMEYGNADTRIAEKLGVFVSPLVD